MYRKTGIKIFQSKNKSLQYKFRLFTDTNSVICKNIVGLESLSCVKGGGTAQAVTEGL